MIFIHYGHKTFDPARFAKIKNQPRCSKPSGGLWASPVDTKWGWKDWCEDTGYRECEKENSFLFTLKPGRLLHICTAEEAIALPQIPPPEGWLSIGRRSDPDFEQLVRDGYDAMWLDISKDPRLYWIMYGWDCDSIIVFNPDAVQAIEGGEGVMKNKFVCQNCGECCGPIPVTRREWERIKKAALLIPEDERERISKQKRLQGMCPFRDIEKKRCAVHKARPEICRMQGEYEGLECPRQPEYATGTRDEGNKRLIARDVYRFADMLGVTKGWEDL